ncbi:MAG: phosphoheptose isomerase [Acidobacteria bacterium]|nr:MAG: phosphoheptose isomerase [Acidobacteriota bacterium]
MAQKTDTDLIAATLAETVALHERFRKGNLQAVADAASVIIEALGRGGKLLLFGNGGSAADAQHAAAELVGRFEVDRAGLAAVALATDTSVITSIANDEGYERVFARQIEALGRKGDVAFGISTSGLSPNVIQGLETAKTRGLRTIALTGHDGGHAGKVAEIHINVRSESTARVQEVHRTVIHVICDLVERSIVQR